MIIIIITFHIPSHSYIRDLYAIIYLHKHFVVPQLNMVI